MEYITPYYTNREQDALFVEDLATGVTGSINATSLGLVAASSLNSVCWGQRNLVSGSQQNLNWGGGIGFFGTSAVSKPTGSNLISSISSLGLASYSVLTGSNLPSLVFNSTGVSYATPTTSSNIAASVTQSGIVTTFSKATGSNFINVITTSGLASQYTAPTNDNIYTSLNASSVVSISAITGNNVFESMASFYSPDPFNPPPQRPSYNSAWVAARVLGFLTDNGEGWTQQFNAPVPTVPNVVSMFSDFPTVVPTANAITLGILPWSDATFSSVVSIHFGLVPSSGGSVTRLVSFGGTVSSSVLTWWNTASFTQSIDGSAGVSSAITLVTSNQITVGNNVGGFCLFGLPTGKNFPQDTNVICGGLAFRVLDITTTAAVLEAVNATTSDINQATAPFRILAF